MAWALCACAGDTPTLDKCSVEFRHEHKRDLDPNLHFHFHGTTTFLGYVQRHISLFSVTHDQIDVNKLFCDFCIALCTMTADPKNTRRVSSRSFPFPALRSLFKMNGRVVKRSGQGRASTGGKEVIQSETRNEDTSWSSDVPLSDAIESIDPLHQEVQDSLLHAIGMAQHDIENRCLCSCSSSTSRQVKTKSTRTMINQKSVGT